MSVIIFTPRGHDYQTKHSQDELYVVMRGSGILLIEDRPNSFGEGDVLLLSPAAFECASEVCSFAVDPEATLVNNSILLGPQFFAEISDLKNTSDNDLLVIGSAELVHALLARDLVDEFRLMIDPVCIGGGKKLFPTDGAQLPLRLISSHAVSTGAIVATYSRDR